MKSSSSICRGSCSSRLDQAMVSETEQSRAYLLHGSVSFSVLIFLTYFFAVLDSRILEHTHTLSLAVEHWTSAEGKTFVAALLITAILFLNSRYPYVLSNAHVDSHPWDHCFITLRLFYANILLILIAFVPLYDSYHPWGLGVYPQLVHDCSAIGAFGLPALSELFVLVKHPGLGVLEFKWRCCALASFAASLLLFMAHMSLVHMQTSVNYCGWSFRYEMLAGTFFIFQCKLIWYFSKPQRDATISVDVIFCMYPLPGLLVVIISDLFRRPEPWLSILIEVFVLVLLTWLCFLIITRLRRPMDIQPSQRELDGLSVDDARHSDSRSTE